MVLKVVEAPLDLPPAATVAVTPLATSAVPLPTDNSASSTQGLIVDNFPRISPTKAKVLFDSPEGWGPWHMSLSQNAMKDLRGFYRADKSVYDIIQKKMKELSDGFFSQSNQKHLAGGPADKAILEAKLTSDLRLVYSIELQTDDQLLVSPLSLYQKCYLLTIFQIDRQVIYMYGIYTHAKLDQRFWAQVANHHPRNNPEYIRW